MVSERASRNTISPCRALYRASQSFVSLVDAKKRFISILFKRNEERPIMSAMILNNNEDAESLHSPPVQIVMSLSASSQSHHVTHNITPELTSSSAQAEPPSTSSQSPTPESRFSKPWQNLSALIAIITVPVMVYFAVKTYNLAAWTATKDYCEFQLNFVVSYILNR